MSPTTAPNPTSRRLRSSTISTTDASREIELSTKQQTTAVEQVNMAASDTTRVTRETEASAVQTKQTAAHLNALSGDLLNLVGTGRAAHASRQFDANDPSPGFLIPYRASVSFDSLA